MKQPLVSFRDFSFTYSDQTEPVLNEVTVTIYEGEKILIVGPSGSGKSTFARCLTGALPNKEHADYSGQIVIEGNGEKGTVVNFLPNELSLSMEESAQVLREKSMQPRVQRSEQPFRSYIEQKKLASVRWFASKYPSLIENLDKLTDNQIENMMAAGQFISDKPLLVFDEPLANLDPASGDLAMEFIDELHKQTNTTIVIIEHRLEDALARPIDRLILFSEGRIIADGAPSDILKTDVLSEIGIREPLYVTAMRYAGVNLDNIQYLDDVHRVNGPHLREEMESWVSYLPQFRYPEYKEDLLRIEHLSFRFPWNSRDIVNDVTLQIRKGEMLSLIGANGSGKTTLARLISGQEKVQSGKIFWKGTDITDFDQEQMADLIGYVPQSPLASISRETIHEEISYRLEERGYPLEEIQKRLREVIHVCGLQYIYELPMAALSYGQLRRVAIASVLVLGPEMIIVDEPAAGQDFRHYTEIMSFLQNIHRQGVTVLLVTHDMQLMLEYTRRALVMKEGEILADTSSVFVLVNPALLEASSLKETSLYTFARHIGMQDPYAFTEKFINYDRVARLF